MKLRSSSADSSGFSKGPPTSTAFWSTLRDYARPYRSRLAFAMVLSLLCGFAVALQPLIIKFIVDEGVSNTDIASPNRLRNALGFSALYLFLGIFRVGVWRIGYVRFIGALEGILFDLRSRFFRHVQGLCFRFHDQVSSGELFNYLMGSPVASIKNFLQQSVMQVPYQGVSWVVAFGTLLYFDWGMTLILLAMVTLIVWVNRRSRKVLKTLNSQFMQEESSVSKFVADMLRGTREIKLHAIEHKISHDFDTQIERIREQSTNVTLQQHLEHIKPELIQYLGFSVLYGFGAWSCIYRDLTVGEFFAFISSVNLLMGPLMTLMQLNLTKANAEAGLERILRILDTESTIPELPESRQADYDRAQREARTEHRPFLEFENVSFQYGSDEWVLQGVSCRIPQGCRVALVGPSGSGKTTFARLVMRLYDPQQGRILLNGEDLRHFALLDLRSRFGVVSQDTFLFQTSILENIRVANPEADTGTVRLAMERAHVSEFVEALPEKEHTQVGENGFTLSGGQKQRLAIARAILGEGRTLIFDEATSALDNESERQIQRAIDALSRERNTLIIAHRLSTIRHVDLILVFDQGRIVQQGTYDELATRPGRFASLLQQGTPSEMMSPSP